jgi:hypothetical protein
MPLPAFVLLAISKTWLLEMLLFPVPVERYHSFNATRVEQMILASVIILPLLSFALGRGVPP